ncbi:MAG: undecaprenyl-diphosphate phosphatase [Chloroflexota bacterium]
MLEALLLGIAQGVSEWLPVSSEGVVTALGSLVFGRSAEEALALALWLHVGTALAALWVLRREVTALAREALRLPRQPSPLLRFAVVATLTSAPVGFVLLAALSGIAAAYGAGAMVAVGGLMVVTALTLARRVVPGMRGRDGLTLTDASLTGLAQGLAALPGISRSGITVAVLLARGVERTEALALSFLIAIPASAGAAVFAAVDSGLTRTTDGLVGALAAAVVGALTMRALLTFARRVNLAWFVGLAGAVVMAGALWQLLAG